ncbi:MAG: AlwI family type II restriction endonuclease [Pyrinomonadaceae bacterium]
MQTWNIGNTTVRNPARLHEALKLFVLKMGGRPFRKPEQIEFQGELIDAGLVDSSRRGGDDGARKFASAFKQLGFITDWSRGKPWTVTPVGANYIAHPEIEATIFLRQLLKYQLPSPLEESRTEGFRLRPFRLLLRFLKRAHDDGLVGLTKFEVSLFVITMLTEDKQEFETAIIDIINFRGEYNARVGKVVKNRFAYEALNQIATRRGLKPGTLLDYADSNSRYALMSGLLTLKGNKLTVSEARLPLINAILADGTQLVPDDEYLTFFYDPLLPQLPTDNPVFLSSEIRQLEEALATIAADLGEPITIRPAQPDPSLIQLQAYEQQLRNEMIRVREIQFYRNQRSSSALDEIEELLEDIRDNNLVGGQFYAPAFFEWAIWRLFLAINDLVGPVSATRGFKVDEDIRPIHHAKGGAADLTFTYSDFKVVCEMTLLTGSQQFAREGEPVTRHVFKAVEASGDNPVYGLFIAKKLDPNTVDAFHNAKYWKDWNRSVFTPVVALEINHILALVNRIRQRPIAVTEMRELFDGILLLQANYDNGPAWFNAYAQQYEAWIASAES